eukprot:Clim_evm23s169 gene=Clim_evmTU23s169
MPKGKKVVSQDGGFKNLWVPAAAIALAGALYAAAQQPEIQAKFPPHSPMKPFDTWEQFYPHYIREHSEPVNKLLHVLAFFIGQVIIWTTPDLIPALISAAAVGYAVFPYTQHLDTGAVEAMATALTFLLTAYATGANMKMALAFPFAGYFFPWIGHFFIEQNKPATFIYPVFSLIGDQVMSVHILTQRVALDANNFAW